MITLKLEEMKQRLAGLVIFRDLLKDQVISAFLEMLRVRCHGSSDTFTEHCATFEAKLFRHGDDWTEYLHNAVMESENVCIRKCASGTVTPTLKKCLQQELNFLDSLAQVRLEDVLDGLDNAPAFLESWQTKSISISDDYKRRMREVGTKGYGIFARYHMFTVEDGQFVPVKHPDSQQLEELPGYEQEREKVIANTKALLDGSPVNNVLLYGDAGTGKSSAIKAIANKFAPNGLRLVEIKKNQLYQIPDLLDSLATNPLKFILFIDDLSFTINDDNFSALKAILEGSVGGRANNIAVYATSNRRHLIKETLTDRAGDDIHESDTRQELMSLSARFGLTITFESPDRDRYLYIVKQLAQQYGLEMDEQELSIRGEAFALRMGGRSARGAKQFVELCKAGVLN